jgi:EAL domain-containing protein (putative c-di-GMP-specific phosphodiesterase class I)
MAYAGETRVSAALDSACLVRALEHAQARRDGLATAVNVGAATLTDPDILRWLRNYRHDERCGTFILEFSEVALLGDPDAAESFAHLAQSRGLALGIKHFGLHPNALSLLRRLRPRHVKFSATLTREALLHPESGTYVSSLTGIATTLSITPVAVAVEHPEALPRCMRWAFARCRGVQSRRKVCDPLSACASGRLLHHVTHGRCPVPRIRQGVTRFRSR